MSKTKNIKCSVETITPEIANQMLALNTKNRKINPPRVEHYCEAMRAGKWELNGETIKINGESLIDGQHRLLAVVRSGVSIDSVVVRGVDSSSFDTVDIGATRNCANVLHIIGVNNPSKIAATICLIHRYYAKELNPNRATKVHTWQIKGLFGKYGDAVKNLDQVQFNRVGFASKVVLSAFAYITSRIDQAASDKFLQQVVSGEMLKAGDPAHTAREELLTNPTIASSGWGGANHWCCLYILVTAWNAFRSGDRITRIKIPALRATADFPVAV